MFPHLKPIPLIRIRQQRIHRMLGDVVLSRIKRMNNLQRKNAPAAEHNGQLVGRHEQLAGLLIIQPVTALLPARVDIAVGVDRFFDFLILAEREVISFSSASCSNSRSTGDCIAS